jgi:hypothetical protein
MSTIKPVRLSRLLWRLGSPLAEAGRMAGPEAVHLEPVDVAHQCKTLAPRSLTNWTARDNECRGLVKPDESNLGHPPEIWVVA